MAKGPHHLDFPHGLVHNTRQFPPGSALQGKHGIGPLGNKGRHHQRKGRYQDHHQRDHRVNGQHNDEGSQNGHDSRKKLGKAHQQAIRKGIHIRNNPAHQLPLGMAVQIAQGQHLDVPEGLIPDVSRHLEGNAVVDFPHAPLHQARSQGAQHHLGQKAAHPGKIHPSCLNNAVNGPANEHRDIQGHNDRYRRAAQGQYNTGGIGFDSVQNLFQRGHLLLISHCRSPPWETGNSRSPDIRGRISAIHHGCPGQPYSRRPAPGSHPQTARRQPAGKQ